MASTVEAKRVKGEAVKANPPILTCFNHKGGVGKTTNSHMIMWGLLEKGLQPLVVDFDPQCNISWSTLNVQMAPTEKWTTFVENRHLLTTSHLFSTRPIPSDRVIATPLKTSKSAVKFVVATEDLLGDTEDFDRTIGYAIATPALFNNLAFLYNNIMKIAEDEKCDVILFDISPSFSATNKFLLAISSFLVTPCAVDCFSENALETLIDRIPTLTSLGERPPSDTVARLIYNNMDQMRGMTKLKLTYLGHVFNNYLNVNRGLPPAVQTARMNLIEALSRALAEHLNDPPPAVGVKLELSRFTDYTSVKNNAQILTVPVAFMNNSLATFSMEVDPMLGIKVDTERDRFQGWRENLRTICSRIIDAMGVEPPKEVLKIRLVFIPVFPGGSRPITEDDIEHIRHKVNRISNLL